MLLSVVFIICIPNILKAGNNTGMLKKPFSDVVNSIFGKERLKFLFTLCPMINNILNTIFNKINSGIVDRGVK